MPQKKVHTQNYKNFFWSNLQIILGISCVVLFLLLLHQCNEKNNAQEETKSVRAFLSDSVDYYKNKSGQLVAEKTALRSENNKISDRNQVLQVLLSKQIDSTRQLTKLVKNFKTIDAAGNITLETELKDIEIPFEEPLGFNFSRRWSKKTPHYFISGFTSEIGTTIDRLKLNTIISFGIGEKKTGFFQNEYRFEATASNPFVKITGLDGATFSQKRKRLGLSLYAGYGLDRNFALTPQIGVGITYDLLQF